MNIFFKLHTRLFIFITTLLIVGTSCTKFVEIDPAPNLVQTDALFANDKTAISAVYGVYAQIRSYNLGMNNGGLSVFCGLSADEISYLGSVPNFDQFFQNTISSDNSYIFSNFWSPPYKTIYQCNAIIDGLTKSNVVTDSVMRQLVGEMKVIRALNYFYLVNLFNDIPLIISTDYQVNSVMKRIPASEIYKQIVDDLLDAKSLLKAIYPVQGKLRINKWAAVALLARVYLYLEDWQNAEAETTEIINSGNYTLSSNLAGNFLINSPETIWEIGIDIANTAEGGTFVPSSSSSKPTYPLTINLVNLFEQGDLRKTNWVKTNMVAGQPYNYSFKYRTRTTATPVVEYEIVLRFAETYLIRAEARAKQNNILGSQQDLNKIRNRSALANTSANNQLSLLAAIAKERQTELFCEWGHRWFDLKRTGTADSILTAVKGNSWQPEDALYPIPLRELETNVFLSQNPGY